MALAMILDKYLDGEVSRFSIIIILILGQPGPWAENLDTLIISLIGADKDYLSLWSVKVNGDLYNAFD